MNRNSYHPRMLLGTGVVLCVAAAFSASPVRAAEGWLSGPSQTSLRSTVVLQGGNFTPDMAVMVQVRAPSGKESAHGAVTNARGELFYQLDPQEAGTYTVTVMPASARVLKPLATVNVIASP